MPGTGCPRVDGNVLSGVLIETMHILACALDITIPKSLSI